LNGIHEIPRVLSVNKILRGIQGGRFGKIVYLYPEIDSTNRFCKTLAQKGLPEGTLVIAETQTDGKGRLGRSWVSPPYLNLTFSILLFPPASEGALSLFTLASANAMIDAIKETLNLQAKVKWPNDILIHGKKVAGILLELLTLSSKRRALILGIGVNVNMLKIHWPEEIQQQSTSLLEVSGLSISREVFLLSLLKQLELWYQHFIEGQRARILSRWKASSETLGRRVQVMLPHRTLEGIAQNLSEEGALLLDLGKGQIHKIYSGDVVHLRPI